MGREFMGYARNPEEPEPTRRELREEYISQLCNEIWDEPMRLIKALEEYGILDEVCVAVLEAATYQADNTD